MKKYTAYLTFLISIVVPTAQQAMYIPEAIIQNPSCWFPSATTPLLYTPIPTVSAALGNSFKNIINGHKTSLGIAALTGFAAAAAYKFASGWFPNKKNVNLTGLNTLCQPSYENKPYVYTRQNAQASMKEIAINKCLKKHYKEVEYNDSFEQEQKEYQQQEVQRLLEYNAQRQKDKDLADFADFETLLKTSLKQHDDTIALHRELKIMEEIIEKKQRKNLSSQETLQNNISLQKQVEDLKEQLQEKQDLSTDLVLALNQDPQTIAEKENEIKQLREIISEHKEIKQLLSEKVSTLEEYFNEDQQTITKQQEKIEQLEEQLLLMQRNQFERSARQPMVADNYHNIDQQLEIIKQKVTLARDFASNGNHEKQIGGLRHILKSTKDFDQKVQRFFTQYKITNS